MRALRIATLTLISNSHGDLLLGEKTNAKLGNGLVNAPGGGWEWETGETILDCAVREPFEETGVVIAPHDLRHLGSLECYVGEILYQRVHVYWTLWFTGIPRETASMKKLGWCPPAFIPYDRMHEGDRYWLPLAAQRKKFRIKIWYERPGEGYIKHVEEEY